jgi:pyruvate carboxylase
MAQFQLRIGDEQHDFDVTRQGDRLHVSNGGDLSAEVRLLHQGQGQLLLEIHRPDGTISRVRLAGSRNGDKRQLWIDGRVVSAERVRRTAARRAAEGSLVSSIPAVVSKVLVEVGDTVAAGDKLILLESMKMVIPIQAPHGGRVARILCSPGDSVPAGVSLLEIEPE